MDISVRSLKVVFNTDLNNLFTGVMLDILFQFGV